jgi:hypothetical protein
MSVTKFDDLDKRVRDLFKDDFTDRITLKIKQDAAYNVNVTSETEYTSSRNLTGKLTFKWKHPIGYNLDKLQVASNGALTIESSMTTPAAPGVRFTFKGNDTTQGDLGVEYTRDNLFATAELDTLNLARIKTTSAFGYQGFTLGGCLCYDLPAEKREGRVGCYKFGLGYRYNNIFASYICQNLKNHAISALYAPMKNLTLGFLSNFACEKGTECSKCCENADCQLGAVYQCNPNTTVRAKASCAGNVALAVTHSPATALALTGSVETSVQDVSNAKLGVQITLG